MRKVVTLRRGLTRTKILLLLNLLIGVVLAPFMLPNSLTAQQLPGPGDEAKKGCCKRGTDRNQYCCTDCCNKLDNNCDATSDCRAEDPES